MSIEPRTHDRSGPIRGCGFLLFVVFPLVLTWLIPTTFIVLTRVEQGGARAEVYPCVFLVVPRSRTILGNLRRVESKVIEGDWVETEDSDGGRRRVREEDEGILLLHSERQKISVPTSPATLEASRSTIERFLEDPIDNRKIVYAVANWKAGFFFMLPFCLLGLAWIIGAVILVLRKLGAAVRRKR